MSTDTAPVVDSVTTSADRLAAFRAALASGQV
ncbi:hypothetical protein RVR_4661 [Actinacidiphila reveromycinica]|uniref:Uncharacterized protein n=1 Tax=Actinacidiphila reveromycinica TaxID=659352 RepID=A0A7U3UTJ1_9ACTN|nr:hypothetical protein RVR_4661 [Streptomyces sp. SN-593]